MGDGTKTGMVSSATCTLDGHLVIIDTWTDSTGAVIDPGLTPSSTVYYAHGGTWTAFLADQGATADTTTLQMQLTNDAAGLVAQGGSAPTPVPLATQQTLMRQVAAVLHGTVAAS